MIQKTLLLLVILVFLLPLAAQTTLGMKAHYVTAWQEYGDLPINGFDQRIHGYGVSAELSFEMSQRLRLNVSPGYVRRGAACEPGFIAFAPIVGVQDATIYTNYLELPLKLQLEWPIVRKLSALAEFGGGIAYMISGHRDIVFFNPTIPIENQPLDFEIESTLNRLDFGLHGGLGLSYDIGSAKVQLLGNYYHGFLDVTDTNTSLNRTLTLVLGYQVLIGE